MISKHVSRREFLRLAGGVAGVSLMAACVPAAPTAAPVDGGAAAPAQEPSTLWVLHKQDFHPDYNDLIRAHIVQFAEERNVELDVAFTAGFAGTGADIQKVAAAVQAGEPPDVWMDNINPFQLNQLGTLQSVTDLQNEIIARYGEPNPRPKAETFLNGEYVGVTLHTRSDGGWARQDVFDAAGVDLSTVRTFEQLRDACMAATDTASEMWGWGMTVNRGGDGGWLIARVLHGWGAQWVDETGEFVRINSPEAIEAVEWLVDLYTNPQWAEMMPPGVLAWTDSSNNEAYLGGKIAYTQNAGTVYAKAVVDGLEIANQTVFHPPVGGPVLQEFNGLGGMYLHLIQGAKSPTLGRELIMSFFEEDMLRGIYTAATAYAVPGYDAMWDWEEIANSEAALALQPVALDPTGWTGLPWPGPSTAHMGAVGTGNLSTDLIANVINGQMTAAEAVEDAHRKSVQIFQEFGAAGE